MSAHSFSFGHHYDPDNLAFGPMRAFDDHRLTRGAGFAEHKHSGVELVTWVAEGAVMHADGSGHVERLPAGSVAVQSAGAGIRHAEHGDADEESTRFLQTWLVADVPDGVPERRVGIAVAGDGLHPVAGAGSEVAVGVRGATLWFGRLAPGTPAELPASASQHLFVLRGTVSLRTPDEAFDLADGDAVRISDAAGTLLSIAAGEPGSEVLLWSFDAA